jgi:hypothetical protein
MRTVRIVVVWFAIAGLSTSAFAGDLHESIAKAAAEQPAPPRQTGIPKSYLWTGSALFVGGMTIGIYSFLHNRNGDIPRFDEANATNKQLGAAGLGLAFVGGTILFLGERQSRRSPTLTFGPGRVGVTKQLTW